GVDVTGRSGECLRDHATARVEQAGRQITGFAHGRAERHFHERARLLFDHRNEPCPEDLLPERQNTHSATSASGLIVRDRARVATRKWPRGSTSTRKSLGTKIVVPASMISAGPVTTSPSRSALRSMRRAATSPVVRCSTSGSIVPGIIAAGGAPVIAVGAT